MRNSGRKGTFSAQLTAISGSSVLRLPLDLGWRSQKGFPRVRLGHGEADLLRVAVARIDGPVPYLVISAQTDQGLEETRHPAPGQEPLLLTIRLTHCESGQIVLEKCVQVSFHVETGELRPLVSVFAPKPSTVAAVGATDQVGRVAARTHVPTQIGPPADRPDVVLIMTDQQRFDQVGYESGGLFETPHIDELAARGMVFDRAYSGGTVCVPARVSLMTGLAHHRVPKQPGSWLALREGFWTIARELQCAGYATALVGKMHATPIRAEHGFETLRLCEHLGYLARRSGMDTEDVDDYHDWLLANGLDDWREATPEEWMRQVGRLFPYEAQFHPTEWVEEEALSVLANRDRNRPLFLIVSFPHPHAPLNPPEPYASRYDPSEMSLPDDDFKVNARLPAPFVDAMTVTRKGRTPQHVQGAEERVRELLAYTRALITQIDDSVGRILEQIDLTKTLVVFTSDHGDYAGHRGMLQKEPWIPFDDLARVPLIVAAPDANRGKRVSSLVQSFDFVPTCLDYAGVKIPTQVFDGRSLRPLLQGSHDPGAVDRSVTCTTPGWPMIRLGRYKYIWHRESDSAVLFDLESDPGETTDLLGVAAFASVGKYLKQLLDEHLAHGIPQLNVSL